jgi:hypothetical protein
LECLSLGFVDGYAEGQPHRVLPSAEDERYALGGVVGAHVDHGKADLLTHVAPRGNFVAAEQKPLQ